MFRWVVCRRVGWSARAAVLLMGVAFLCLRAPLSSRFDADFPHHRPDQLSQFLADFNNHPKLYTHISGSWQIEEERNNYTWWQYVVSYECGARCVGRVAVGAGVDGDTLRHGRAVGEHRMHVRDERCMHLPLLFWPQMCDYNIGTSLRSYYDESNPLYTCQTGQMIYYYQLRHTPVTICRVNLVGTMYQPADLAIKKYIIVETETETIIKPRVGGGAHLSERHVSRCSALAALTRSCGAYTADERERTLRAAMRTTIN